ncbi:DUF4245 domain-containing protein [Nonomuraea sp. NPDC046570]|uniref:DUF4245 domain-containing protein n=1 Tax=Nonomuraea sp. NPDC046570 TaxID=3155255 RepID=UPI00340A5150
MRRFTEGFYGYAVALLVCVAAAGLFLLITPQSREEHIPRLDYTITVANFNRAVPYQVWGPAKDPVDWVPNSNRIAKGDKGADVLYLGYATDKRGGDTRAHAMFAQSGEQPAAAFASRLANTDKAAGTQQIGGQAWERRFREDKNQRSLIRFLPDTTLIVTGTADWDQLATYAATLKLHPKPTS